MVDLDHLIQKEFIDYQVYIKEPNKNSKEILNTLRQIQSILFRISPKSNKFVIRRDYECYSENEKLFLQFDNVNLAVEFFGSKEEIKDFFIFEFIRNKKLKVIVLDSV